MTGNVEIPTRHGELGERLRDLTKVIRLLRQRRGDDRPAVPVGLLGTLMYIDACGTGVPGCHAKDLAAEAGLDPSTVSRAVASLVAHGLVERQADPADRRASVLALTGAGRAALTEAQNWYGGVLDRALAAWRPEELDVLSALLGRFITDLERTLTTENLEAAR
ncbi:MarR family winged helix-turn-helix transcriptional regulator [Rhizomonospora bruguierae]|uniref:MarR family winged helix-turn-helix transcriptional regulator n=1 Tax=Rhizomonospora bruguierae TaxID=1581705 RepID=UPI0020C02456|nr:MarR family winged helix-turn-helix transcriptional regulator [Micromonospora sp. NBRC 107566]